MAFTPVPLISSASTQIESGLNVVRIHERPTGHGPDEGRREPMDKNRLASEGGEAKQQPTGAVALFVTLVSFSTLAMAETRPKVYDCGDRKMEVFEPEGGVLKARIDDFDVEISIRERHGTVGARFSVTVTGPKAHPGTQTSARSVPVALDSACRIVARYYKSLEEPSEEALAKQLIEFYEQL